MGKKESAEYRRKHSTQFKKIGENADGPVFGGFKRGIVNGPAPSTPRGKRRAAK